MSDYLEMMEAEEARRKSALAASATLGSNTSPEEVARKKRISNLLGVPVAAVDGDPDTANSMALTKTIEQDTRQAPALRQKYTDEEFMKLAHDQSRHLSMVERVARNLAAGFGGDFTGSGISGVGHSLNAAQSLLSMKGSNMDRYLKEGGSPIGTGLVDIGETTKKYWQGLAPKDEATFSDQAVRGVGQMVGQIPLYAVSAPLGVLTMYGQGADQMKEKIDNDKVAQKASQIAQDLEVLSGGAVTMATEWLSTKLLLGLPQAKMLQNRLLNRAAQVALGGVGEGAQELSENIFQDVAHIALTNPDSRIALGEAVEAGGVGAVVGVLVESVIQAALHMRGMRHQKSFADLSDATKQQKLKERDPQTYQDFADAVTAHLAATSDGPIENLYIDANQFHQLMVDNQIDPNDVVQYVPAIAEQFDEAKATGGDIVIPLNEYVGKIAGAELNGVDVNSLLSPHLRSSADSLSITQLQEAQKEALDMQARAEEIIAQQIERKEWEKSASEVQQTIFDQIKSTGVYTPAVAQAYASMVRDFYVTNAAQMGVTPGELYAAYPYQVKTGELAGETIAQDPDGLTYNQSTGEINTDANFQRWFGESKVVDEDGKPLVVYHGTDKNFTEFKNMGGKVTVLFSTFDVPREGFFFSPDEKTGQYFGRNVMPVYLSIQNPADLSKIGTDAEIRLIEEKGINPNWLRGKHTWELFDEEDGRIMVQALKELGYDGAIIDEPGIKGEYDSGLAYVAFSPTQIKSVYNRGTWDPNDANIMRQSLSTRVPSAVKATEDPMADVLTVDYEIAKADPAALKKNMDIIMKLPNMRKLTGAGAKDAVRQAEAFIDHVENNLLWLHDMMPEDLRARASMWYDGGNRFVQDWSFRYGVTPMQSAAAIAVLSPQKDWFINVSLAERVLDALSNRRDFEWSESMDKVAVQISKDGKLDDQMKAAKGKKLSEVLSDPTVAARWIRVYDQAHNDRSYRTLTPEGGVLDYAKTKSGENSKAAWGSYGEISKAVSVILNGSADNVFKQLGRQHKVRNFYNNLFDPNSDRGFTAIDTHAVAASLLRPLSGNSPEVLQAFGQAGGSSSITGLQGSYALYQEAYRRAAEKRNILPRQMQSITWEAVRGLFESAQKNKMLGQANAVWSRYKKGEIEQDQAQKELMTLAGSITPPIWSGVEFHDAISPTFTNGLIAKIREVALQNPMGFTINVSDGSTQTTGYAVAPSKYTELRLDALTAADLENYLDKFRDVFESDSRAFLGGWKDEETGTFVLDISFVVESKEDALYLAEIGNQDAIFHLDELNEVRRENGIEELKASGVYSPERRDALRGIQESLHAALRKSGALEQHGDVLYQPARRGAARTAQAKRKSAGGGISATGVHFSADYRKTLSTSFFGTGTSSAEAARLANAPDLQERLYFYLNTGDGVSPEPGVGSAIHVVPLSNLYDSTVDPLNLKVGVTANDFERAVMANGFDGYLNRDYGVAVILGPHKFKPKFAENLEDVQTIPALEPAQYSPAQVLSQELKANQDIPQGFMTGPRWVDTLQTEFPDLYQRLDQEGYIEPLRSYNEKIKRSAIPFVKETLFQSAWHGSPHTFDKFSTEKIGTGEGAQAYGYGLYFAGKKEVAEFYKKSTTRGANAILTFDGKEIKFPKYESDLKLIFNDNYTKQELRDIIGNAILDAEHFERKDDANKLREILEAFNVAKNIKLERGRLYQVELAPDDDEYLLWDKPLSEQSEKVRGALEKAGVVKSVITNYTDPEKAMRDFLSTDYAKQFPNDREVKWARMILTDPDYDIQADGREWLDSQMRAGNGSSFYNLLGGSNGAQIYDRLAAGKSQKAASEYLHGLGIRGIKYLDGTSRGKREGTYNYVIFSDDDVAITEMFQKMNGDKRGGFNPDSLTTILTQQSDLSTFLHETAHFFLTSYAQMASAQNAPVQLQQDMQTILTWFGVPDLATWNAMPLAEQRKHHEAFAYNYEIYLFEGKAPNVKMQALFERFSAWLKKIYHSITTELNSIYKQEHGTDLPILTGEVKQVLDRMLASDEQIRQAELVRNMAPIFRTQEEAGMTNDEWGAYQLMQAEATEAALSEHRAASLRQMKWLSNARGRILKDLQAQANSARKALTVQVTDEMNRDPIYIAQAAMKNAAEEEQLALADALGYRSIDELKTAIANAPKKADAIRDEVDKRMLEEYGELVEPKALERSVEAALHNEARARFVSVELRHLSKSLRPARVMQEAARQAARAILGKKAIGTIRPREYSAAEARAAAQAEDSLKRGGIESATQAKEHQLLNNQLAAEAARVTGQIEKALENYKKVFASDKKLGKSRDMNYVNTARAILAHYGFGSSEQPAAFYLAKIKAYDPEFYAEIEGMITAHQAQAKEFKKLTLDEFRDLNDQISALWHLSRRNKQIEIDGQLMDRRAVVGELNDEIRDLDSSSSRPGYAKAVTKWEQTKIKLLGAKAALRRVEAWADAMDKGSPAGKFRKYIWTPISESVTKYRLAKATHLTKYIEILKDVEPILKGGDIAAPEIGYTFKPQELLHAILHTGNDSNKKKLLVGRGWADFNDDGKTINTSRWDSFVARAQAQGLLTKAHYDFAQKVWDLMEQMKPEAQKAHRQMYGFYFNEITASAFETPFGVYAGGYVPAVTDPDIVTDASMNAEKETQLVDNSFMFPTTGRGFTMGRVEYNKPLLLNLGYLASHMDKVLRFTHIEPRVKDVARIVKTNRAFAEEMDKFDPTIRGDMLVPWLQRTAMQMVSIPSKGKAGQLADSVFRYIRTTTGMQMMVGNIVNTLQQFTGVSITALKVKPRYLRNALWQYIRQPKDTMAMIIEKSKYMATRVNSDQYELQKTMDELLLNPNKYEKLQDFASKHGYFMQQATQGVVDTISWIGAYNQAIEDNADEKDAVRQADAAVRMTQGSFAPEDVSRIETGSAFMRAFTQFYSYFNMQANILGTEFVNVARNLGVKKGMGRLLYIYTFGFMVPAVLAETIVQATGGFDDGDDDEYDLGDAMRLFFNAQWRPVAAMVPGAGQIITAGVNRFNDKYYDDRISTSPAVSMLESAVSAPHSVYKAIADDGSWKRATRDVINLLGALTGLPVGQLGKPAGYLMDVAQGNITPEGDLDVVRGVLTGKDVNRKQ